MAVKKPKDEKDTQVAGLYRQLGKTKTSWLVKKRVRGGNPKSIVIGDASLMSVREARREATKVLAELDKGIDPVAQAKATAAHQITLGDAINKFLSQRRGTLKESTSTDYQRVLHRNIPDWMKKPITAISRDDVVEKYHEIREQVAARKRLKKAQVNEPGVAEADKTMRYLSAVYSYYVGDRLGDSAELLLPHGNPVDALKTKKIKTELKKRTTHLDLTARLALRDFLADPSHFYNSDGSYKTTRKAKLKADQADWLFLLMLTGMRLREPLGLTWADVNFNDKLFTIIDNKSKRPLTLPMSETIERIFQRRHKATHGFSDYVFPQASNPNKPATMSKVIERVSTLSGVDFIAHDLRRTQATVLRDLGYTLSDIGRILNHSRLNQTDDYIGDDIDRVKEAFERVEWLLFKVDDSHGQDNDTNSDSIVDELTNTEPL